MMSMNHKLNHLNGEETKLPYMTSDNEDAEKPQSSSGNLSHDKAESRWITIEPVIFLASIGNGTLATLRSEYLQDRIADDVYNYTYPTNTSCVIKNTSDPDYIIEQDIQADAANWSIYLGICSYLPLIFTGILLGKWSDYAGRKMALGLPFIGMILQTVVYLVVITCHMPLPVLIPGELAYGLSGGHPLVTTAGLAYIADVTSMKDRTFRLVVVGTCFLIPIGLAQLVIGYLVDWRGFTAPFYLLLASQLAALAYVCIPGGLYESIRYKDKTEGVRSQIVKLYHGIIDLFANNVDNRRWRLLLINAIFIPIGTVTDGYMAVITLYAIGQPFCWSSILVGIYRAISLALMSIANIVGAKLLGMRLADIWILHISLLSMIGHEIVLGLAHDTFDVFLSSIVGCFRTLSLAISRSMASKCVSADEQGVTFSILAALDSIVLFLAPMIFQLLYSVNVVHGNPGVPFLVLAGVAVVAEILAWILHGGFLTGRSSYNKIN